MHARKKASENQVFILLIFYNSRYIDNSRKKSMITNIIALVRPQL
jgi:hypothetical protein